MFTNSVLAAIRSDDLLRAGDRVVVAASGGPDSMALLEVLAELRERLGLWLCVAHLNHGLRGTEAEADAGFVAARAAELGLPARLGQADVAGERHRGGGSLEAVARRVRYGFLARVAEETGAAKVATGHTADDQVETILEGLLRGGGLGALCGMPCRRPMAGAARATLVRPLLDVRRAQVLAYLAERGVGYRVDASNADMAFERNAVRHELLPALEGRVGPVLRGDLLGVARRARVLAAVVEREAGRLVDGGSGEARLGVESVAAAPRLVRRAAVRLAYQRAGGRGELRRRAIDAVEGLLGGGSGRQVDLAGGLVARRRYGELHLARPGDAGPVVDAVLTVPGRVEVAEAGLWVEAEEMPAGQSAPPYAAGDPWVEVVDLDRVGARLAVRTRRAGDRFQPLGLGGSKKLKDFLIDQRVPRDERGRTLVVAGREGIAWVVGLRVDERAKVGAGTRRLVRLRAGRL
jgi:tRNA(Ile)-lysidine synthase